MSKDSAASKQPKAEPASEPTIGQLAAKVADLQSQVDELRSGVHYAVYGIGNPHPDPRDQGELVDE